MEIKFHGMNDGLSLATESVTTMMNDFGDKAATATLAQAAKLVAKGRGKGSDKGPKGKGKGKDGTKGGPPADR